MKGKIIITGPGRSGTTFLAMFLTRMGYDTGYTPYEEPFQDKIRAGLEEFAVELSRPKGEVIEQLRKFPRILKAPEWSMYLKLVLRLDLFPIDHVIMPIRDLTIAARSRLETGLEWMTTGELSDQENVLAMTLGKVVEACLLFEVPLTILKFPALVTNSDYLYRKLKIVFPEMEKEQFEKVFNETANPDMIQTGGLHDR